MLFKLTPPMSTELSNDQLMAEMQKTVKVTWKTIRAMQDLLKHEDKSNDSDFSSLCEVVKDFLEDHEYETPYKCWSCHQMVDSRDPRHQTKGDTSYKTCRGFDI